MLWARVRRKAFGRSAEVGADIGGTAVLGIPAKVGGSPTGTLQTPEYGDIQQADDGLHIPEVEEVGGGPVVFVGLPNSAVPSESAYLRNYSPNPVSHPVSNTIPVPSSLLPALEERHKLNGRLSFLVRHDDLATRC